MNMNMNTEYKSRASFSYDVCLYCLYLHSYVCVRESVSCEYGYVLFLFFSLPEGGEGRGEEGRGRGGG